MSNCPTCNKPVDPLRSRFVKVRDGKVVAYCSAEHMQAAETKPTIVPPAAAAAEDSRRKDRARTPASGIPTGTSPSLETGPVIEIVKDKTAPAEKPVDKPKKSTRSEPRIATPPPIEDGSLDPWNAGEEGDDEEGGRKSITMPTQKRSAGLAIVLIALLGAGGAYLGYRFLLMDRGSSEQTPEQPPPPPPKKPEPPPAKPVTAAEAVTKARDVLMKQLASESPRVQRVAASALARTGDTKAIEYLISALAKETSDVSKLDLAYALARAGDKKGIDTLVTGLQSARRDARIQAGRQLALIGDKRAAPVLASYLEVSQLRLGAAEQLAFLADPAAIKALEQVRADAKSSADEKARATIALGIAGKSDVIPDLQALLKDARFNAFAASALAQLKDASGKPVLVEQLAVPSLRVEAARALRRLDPALDPAPYLPQLLGALDSHKDTEQVQVAEAILLLAGDAGWSEHP